jgi:hypothetical protein
LLSPEEATISRSGDPARLNNKLRRCCLSGLEDCVLAGGA